MFARKIDTVYSLFYCLDHLFGISKLCFGDINNSNGQKREGGGFVLFYREEALLPVPAVPSHDDAGFDLGFEIVDRGRAGSMTGRMTGLRNEAKDRRIWSVKGKTQR